MRSAASAGGLVVHGTCVGDGFVFFFGNRGTSERPHRCFGTVVWKVQDNGEPWSAIGAIDESIIQTGSFFSCIFHALAANRNVGADLRNIFGYIVTAEDIK